MGEPQETMYSADMPGVQEQDQPLPEEDRNPSRGGVISFPDLLAPGSRLNQEGQVARFATEYSPYTRRGIRVRSHSPSLLDPNLFRVSRKVSGRSLCENRDVSNKLTIQLDNKLVILIK